MYLNGNHTNQSGNPRNTTVRSHQRGENKPVYSTFKCRFEENGGTCKRSDCSFLHTKKENIPLGRPVASGGGGAAVLVKKSFDPVSHLRLPPPPQKTFKMFLGENVQRFNSFVRSFPKLIQSQVGVEKLLSFLTSADSIGAFKKNLSVFLEGATQMLEIKDLIVKSFINYIEKQDESSSDAVVADDADDDVNNFLLFLSKCFGEQVEIDGESLMFPKGTFSMFFDELPKFIEILESFNKDICLDWENYNLPVPVPVSVQQPKSQSSISRCDVSGLIRKETDMLNALNQADHSTAPQRALISATLQYLNSVKGLNIPMSVLFSQGDLQCFSEIVDRGCSHMESVTAFLKEAELQTVADGLRVLNIEKLSESVDQSVSLKAFNMTMCLLFGKHSNVFEEFKTSMCDEDASFISSKVVEYFRSLMHKLTRRILKGTDEEKDFGLLVSSDLIDEAFKSKLRIMFQDVFLVFKEKVLLSQTRVVEALEEMKKNSEVEDLMKLLMIEFDAKQFNPKGNEGFITFYKLVDYLSKNLKALFRETLHIEFSSTFVEYVLNYNSESVDVSELVAMFFVRILLVNRILLENKVNPFYGNFKSYNSDQDDMSLSPAFTSAFTFITSKALGCCSEVLSSSFSQKVHDILGTDEKERVNQPTLEERLRAFLDRVVLESLRLHFKKDDAKKHFENVIQESTRIFGSCQLSLSILTSGAKSSLNKLFTTGVMMTTEQNNVLLQGLAGFIQSNNPIDFESCKGLPFFGSVCENMMLALNEPSLHMKNVVSFYDSLRKLMKYLLMSLTPEDLPEVWSLYSQLEMFNTSDPKNSVPYMTQFFCMILVALRNNGMSLQDAIITMKTAICNPIFKPVAEWKPINSSIFKFISNAKKHCRFDLLHSNQRGPIPIPIQSLFEQLSVSSVCSNVSFDEVKNDMKNVISMLFIQDTTQTNKTACQITLANMGYTFVSMVLSGESLPTRFCNVYGIELTKSTESKLSSNTDKSSNIFVYLLKMLAPGLKAFVSREMNSLKRLINQKDQESLEASGFLSDQDKKFRFEKGRTAVILKVMKDILVQMGMVSCSSIASIDSIRKLLECLQEKEKSKGGEFSLISFFQSLAKDIRIWTFSDPTSREISQEFRKITYFLKQQEQQEQQKQQEQEPDGQTWADYLPCAVSAVVVCEEALSIVKPSADELFEELHEDIQRVVNPDVYPVFIVDFTYLIKVMQAIFTQVTKPIPRQARFNELREKFNKCFTTTIASALDIEIDIEKAELSQELIDSMKIAVETNYSSLKAYTQYCFGEESKLLDDEIFIAYSDAVREEFVTSVQQFCADNESRFTVSFDQSDPMNQVD